MSQGCTGLFHQFKFDKSCLQSMIISLLLLDFLPLVYGRGFQLKFPRGLDSIFPPQGCPDNTFLEQLYLFIRGVVVLY